MQFRVCEFCGAHLDPDEKCDCEEEREAEDCKQEEKKKPETAALNNSKL